MIPILSDGLEIQLSVVIVMLVWALLSLCCMESITQISTVVQQIRVENSTYLTKFYVSVILLYDLHIITAVYNTWTVNLYSYVQVLQLFPALFLMIHSYVQIQYMMNPNRYQGDPYFRFWNFMFNIVMLIHYGSFSSLTGFFHHDYQSFEIVVKVGLSMCELFYRIMALSICLKVTLFNVDARQDAQGPHITMIPQTPQIALETRRNNMSCNLVFHCNQFPTSRDNITNFLIPYGRQQTSSDILNTYHSSKYTIDHRDNSTELSRINQTDSTSPYWTTAVQNENTDTNNTLLFTGSINKTPYQQLHNTEQGSNL